MDSSSRPVNIAEAARPLSQRDQRLFVSTAEKALTVLRAFYQRPKPLSLTEVAEVTGLGRSAAQRFLYTLRLLGYLRQDAETRRYRLSPKVLDFGFAYLRNDYLVEKAFPYLLEASKRTDETVNLTELDGSEVIYVSRFPSRNVISVDIVLGARLPAFCTAPGRAMLARLPEAEMLAILDSSGLEPLTPHTITDREQLLAEIANVRAQHFAIANQEAFIGDLSTAAPVLGHDGRVVAAVNIAVPTPRWSVEAMERDLTPIVIETARAISKALGRR